MGSVPMFVADFARSNVRSACGVEWSVAGDAMRPEFITTMAWHAWFSQSGHNESARARVRDPPTLMFSSPFRSALSLALCLSL